MGFPRQEHWNGLLFPSPGDLPNPGIEPVSPAWRVDSFTTKPPGKPLIKLYRCKTKSSKKSYFKNYKPKIKVLTLEENLISLLDRVYNSHDKTSWK